MCPMDIKELLLLTILLTLLFVCFQFVAKVKGQATKTACLKRLFRVATMLTMKAVLYIQKVINYLLKFNFIIKSRKNANTFIFC